VLIRQYNTEDEIHTDGRFLRTDLPTGLVNHLTSLPTYVGEGDSVIPPHLLAGTRGVPANDKGEVAAVRPRLGTSFRLFDLRLSRDLGLVNATGGAGRLRRGTASADANEQRNRED
jgi:hypothetical protein